MSGKAYQGKSGQPEKKYLSLSSTELEAAAAELKHSGRFTGVLDDTAELDKIADCIAVFGAFKESVEAAKEKKYNSLAEDIKLQTAEPTPMQAVDFFLTQVRTMQSSLSTQARLDEKAAKKRRTE